MFKNFPKINTFVIIIFIFGIMLGVLSGIGIGIKYFFENKTFVPGPTECQPVECQSQETTRNVTGSVKFRSCLSDKTGQCVVQIDNVLLAIVGQNGKIIKTATTDKNGEAEITITVPVDPLFNISPKWPDEKGVINVVSFKEGYVETVIFNASVFPGKWLIEENIIYDIPLRLANSDPYQRNDPTIIDRGGLHRLEEIGLIQAVADALNLKPAYY